MPKADLTALQKKGAGPEALLVVCKACAENCFVPGRVSFGSTYFMWHVAVCFVF